jgi:hypothetical protein
VIGLTFENIKGVALSRYFEDIGERSVLMMQINVLYLIIHIRNSRNNGTILQGDCKYVFLHSFHTERSYFYFCFVSLTVSILRAI